MKTRYLTSLFLVWFTVGWVAAVRVEAQQTSLPPEVIYYPETVLYNGKILTADAQFSVVEAVAVRAGRVLAIGTTSRILAMAGPSTRKIDLKGKTATPGIFDLHQDVFGSALIWHWTKKFFDGKQPKWETKEQALAGIKSAIARAKPGEPVVINKLQLDVPYEAGAGGKLALLWDVFTLQEMDALAPNNPVFFNSVINSMVLAMNTAGAEAVKRFLPKGVSTPFVEEGKMGVATGFMDQDGILSPGQFAAQDYLFWYEPPDMEPALQSYRDIQREQNSAGVVLIRGHMGVPLFNGVRALWEREELTIRFRMPFPLVPQISGHASQVPPEEAEILMRRWANMSRIGDNMLRVVGMRVPAVGGNLGGGSALLLEPKTRPFPDRLGNPAPYGGWPEEQEALEKGLTESFRGRELLIQACRLGWDTAADHTEGDRAYREVIKAYEECLKDQVVKRPGQRLTTGHTGMTHPDDIAKAGKLGVLSNISTGHSFGVAMEAALLWAGSERMNTWSNVKTFLNDGIHPGLESTFWYRSALGERYSTTGTSAFYWMSKYITRKDPIYGRVWNAKEALNRQETLWAGTVWAAEQLAEEKQIGGIAVGKEADLVVIDKDYMTVPQDEIEKIQVLLTMVGGKVVHEVAGAL